MPHSKDSDLEKDAHQELERMEWEFSMLYEISNAMRTTLKLDQVLYIVLTALTSHEGLGFNRAMLFLVNDRESMLEGIMGIGPHSAEEAGKIWSAVSSSKMTLEDFIEAYDSFRRDPDSKLNTLVKGMKIPLREDMGILALTILEGMPFEITTEEAKKLVDPEILSTLNTDYFVTVPLKAKDKILGAILVDNIFNKKPITKSDVRMLTMFANHAGLAIENSRLFEDTIYLAKTDCLTGLWNYGRFQDMLTSELDRAKHHQSNLSLVMIDVDNFKYYNDTFGHLKGDETLRTIAGVFREKSRKYDFTARYGGEEFAIIMPDASKESARVFAERIRTEIEKIFVTDPPQEQKKYPTISLGVATYPEDASNKDELISRADMALYEAKRTGKNKTCLYSKDMGQKRPR